MAFKKLGGRITLVTGGARGIGRATAEAFLAAGAPVAVCDVDEDALATTTDELGRQGTRVRGYVLDVRDAAAFDAVVTRVENDLGPVDILVNNAGIMPVGPFLDLPPMLDDKQIAINLIGVCNGMRAVLPRMERRHRGHVVNVASSAGKVGIPFAATYSATKHAVVGLTEAVRQEMIGSGVGFSYVMPALVDTELISGTGRLRYPPPSTPQEVASAIVDAVRTGKVDVYVPRWIRVVNVLPAVLPRRVYEGIGRLFQVDRVFEHVDAAAREAYRRRMATD